MGTINVDTIKNNVGGNTEIKIGDASLSSSSGNLGIATTSPSYQLQVNGSVDILNVQGSTGNAFVRFTDSDASADFSIGADDNSGVGAGAFILYDRSNSAYRLKVDASGALTIPSQPAFLANPASVQSNISSGDTIAFGTEVFDQNGDFASNTFTAPLTGKYQFNLGLFLEQVDTDQTELRIKLVTSNRTYDHFDIGSPFSSDRNLQYHLSVLADMDASDTAVVQVTFSSGAAQMDVNVLSFFSGHLVC